MGCGSSSAVPKLRTLKTSYNSNKTLYSTPTAADKVDDNAQVKDSKLNLVGSLTHDRNEVNIWDQILGDSDGYDNRKSILIDERYAIRDSFNLNDSGEPSTVLKKDSNGSQECIPNSQRSTFVLCTQDSIILIRSVQTIMPLSEQERCSNDEDIHEFIRKFDAASTSSQPSADVRIDIINNPSIAVNDAVSVTDVSTVISSSSIDRDDIYVSTLPASSRILQSPTGSTSQPAVEANALPAAAVVRRNPVSLQFQNAISPRASFAIGSKDINDPPHQYSDKATTTNTLWFIVHCPGKKVRVRRHPALDAEVLEYIPNGRVIEVAPRNVNNYFKLIGGKGYLNRATAGVEWIPTLPPSQSNTHTAGNPRGRIVTSLQTS